CWRRRWPHGRTAANTTITAYTQISCFRLSRIATGSRILTPFFRFFGFMSCVGRQLSATRSTKGRGTPMIDLKTEAVLTMAEAARHPILCKRRGGARLHPSTLWRWCMRGVPSKHGGAPIKLETVLQGPNTRVTSVEALERFFERLTIDRDGAVVKAPRTSR